MPALALLLVLAACMGAPTVLLWCVPALLFVVIPALDALLGDDSQAPCAEQADVAHAALSWLLLPLQWATFAAALTLAARPSLSAVAFGGLVATVGAVNGLAIVAAHEIGHHAGALAAAAARIALAPACYGHFRIEHNRGHHRRVATLLDPASARLGEGFWRFLPRSVAGGAVSAWRIEAVRLARLRRMPWHGSNECLQSHAISAMLVATAWVLGNGHVALFVLLQAAYAISLLEAINYIEHYGLKRQSIDGKLERCAPKHSWNCDSKLSNRLLFNLQRHSDHHAHPARRYQTLRADRESPQLPIGYAGLMWAVYLPPVWFAVMDRRVLSYCAGSLAQANVHPSDVQALLRKWPPVAAPASAQTPTT